MRLLVIGAGMMGSAAAYDMARSEKVESVTLADVDHGRVKAAVQRVREIAQPISNVRGSATYKRHMAVEFAFRALREATRRAQWMSLRGAM